MKIYDKRFDAGETKLYDGRMVGKDSRIIQAIGVIDELNSLIGFARVAVKDQRINDILCEIQKDLLTIGSDLSKLFRKEALTEGRSDVPRITVEHIEEIEGLVRAYFAEAGEIRKFVLPAGSESASRLHICRTVARRAERRLVALKRVENINEEIIRYLNRLSDLLFAFARVENKRTGTREEFWH